MRVFAPVVAFIAATVVSGYVPSVRSVRRSTLLMSASKSSSDAPPLCRAPARKVCLMVEPTPFTHVSGYANRFKYMLQYLAKAGDKVEILTVDSKTDPKDLPNESFGFPIEHTMGFTFPWYNQISLTIDLPELKGGKILERFRPDLIHVTSPGLMVYAAIFYARVMRIPLRKLCLFMSTGRFNHHNFSLLLPHHIISFFVATCLEIVSHELPHSPSYLR
mmetsp:Transcript_31219/g.45703  ORF Transcript_31219/g.45703 Transcript_31219/m.45703 type:complete len:219 (-) Transcript_31219:156-812(-)